MTDGERQTLCRILRTMEPWPCKKAADEIERLANAEAIWKGRAEAYLKIANDEAKELAELKTTFRIAAIELGDPRTRQHPERQKKF